MRIGILAAETALMRVRLTESFRIVIQDNPCLATLPGLSVPGWLVFVMLIVYSGYFEASSQASGKLSAFRVSSAASASPVVTYLP